MSIFVTIILNKVKFGWLWLFIGNYDDFSYK